MGGDPKKHRKQDTGLGGSLGRLSFPASSNLLSFLQYLEQRIAELSEAAGPQETANLGATGTLGCVGTISLLLCPVPIWDSF